MSTSSDIAIVGMAGVFPKAPDVAAFWENILAKVDAVTDAPPQWGADLVYDPTSSANNRIYTKRGGFLGELARFNPLEYGVPPQSIQGNDPEHFLALRIAHEALADAGYLDRPFDRARTAVIIGRSALGNRGIFTVFQHGVVIEQTIRLLATLHPEYSADELEHIKHQLRADLPPFTAETAPGLVSSLVCGRIANRLDLMGPAYTVDAACASALAAVELAMSDLTSGKVDLALAGGVQTATNFLVAQAFCQLRALSRSGAVRPFSPDADGTLLGEGAGILVLKRREDAERAGDRIYALIKAVGMASDGRAVGILAPRIEGQELAIRRAYERTGIAAHTVSLVEGHGTGTLVGDAVELEALNRVFGPEREGDAPDGRPAPWCALGSVKSMIGHLIPAAGAAGLIKAALALYHKVLPPTLHTEAGNPKLASTPFYLNTEARPWIHAGPQPRRAAVSAFGFGGINAHAILEEHASAEQVSQVARPRLLRPHVHRNFDAEVVVLSAPDRGELLTRGGELRRLLSDHPDLSLIDLAYTLNCPSPALAASAAPAARLAVVATSIADLQAKLGHALGRLTDPDCHHIDEPGGIYYTDTPLYAPGTLAFLFPGNSAQYVNMLADLCIHFPAVRVIFDRMDRVHARHQHGVPPSRVIFPPPGGPTVDPTMLESTTYGFAAVLTGNQALYSLLSALDIQPDAVLGHSLGGYSAIAVAHLRWTDEADLLSRLAVLNEDCDQLFGEGIAPAGGLVAITTSDREPVLALVRRSAGALTVAMDNSPHHLVLSGCAEAATAAANELKQAGIPCTMLPFEHPYHTAAFTTFAARLRARYESKGKFELKTSRIALYSCLTAERCPNDPEAVLDLATDYLSRPVRFRETIQAMYRDGVRIFVEAGPRGSLSSFVDDTLRGTPHLAVPSNVASRSGLTQLAHLVGLLAAHRVPMNLGPLYAHRSSQRLPLRDDLSLEDGRVVAESATDDRAMPLNVQIPLLTLDQPVRPRESRHGSGVAEPPGFRAGALLPAAPARPDVTVREQVMQEYLATMDRFLEVQRHIMNAALPSGGQLPAPADQPGLPLLGSVVSLVEGEELVTIRRLDVDEDLFLHDHTFGRRVSVTDESLLALPVVPLTISMEMMAEAAVALYPGQVVIGLRDVRAYQWITLDEGHATLQVVARRNPTGDGREVTVELRRISEDAAAGSQTGTRVAQGVVRLAPTYSTPPAHTPLILSGERPYAQSTTGLYSAGRMFHGPRFQGVVSLDRCGADGTEGTLQTLPTHNLFASTPDPTLVTDPALLDAAAQLIGFWALEHFNGDYVGFPFALEELRLFQTTPAPATPVRGLARIGFVNERQVRADIDLVDPAGRLLAQLVGWSNHGLDLIGSLLRIIQSGPGDVRLGTPWETPISGLPAAESFACWRIGDLELDALAVHGRIQQRILASLILGRPERAIWTSLPGSDQFRSQWLLDRAVAKEAICAFLRDRFALHLNPADIGIVTDEYGNLVAVGSWTSQVERTPLVSLAQCDGVVVAIASADRRCRGIGIQLRRIDPTDDEERALRLQCAQEAAVKALGLAPPTVLATADLDPDSGVVRVNTETSPTAPVAASPEPLTVRTVRDGDQIAAVAIRWGEPTSA
jgi:acyl transferase domain-containing protein